MQDKNNKFFVGKVKNFTQKKSWFFGHFMNEELLKSDLVEVAWQDISGLKPSPGDKHFHKQSIEINIVITGKVKLKINGEPKVITKGEFYIIYPFTTVDAVEAEENTQMIVIRAPSIRGDKFFK